MLFGGVATLSLLACIYLLLRTNNAFDEKINPPLRLRRWTAVFFATMAASHLWWLFVRYTPQDSDLFNRILLCTILDTVTSLPAMLCTMLVMLQDRRRPLWPVVVIVALALAGILLDYHLGDQMSVVSILLFLIVILMIAIPMKRAVTQYGRWLRDNYADLEHKEVWQIFLVMAAFLLVSVAYTFANDYVFFEILIEVADILLIAILLWRVETLQTLEEPTDGDDTEDMPANLEAALSDESSDLISHIGTLLHEHCVDTQYYLNQDISVSQLAAHIGTSRKNLGLYFAQQGTTYNSYINGLRIQYFIRQHKEFTAAKHNVTARQLALDCGFSSYSTFLNAFKQHMGQTFTEWMLNF